MCLYVSKPRNKNRKFVYKRFIRAGGKLVSPYRNTIYELGKEKKAAGLRKETKYKIYSRVQAGIHAYSNLKAAKNQRLGGEVIVRCSVDPEDWLVDGENEDCLYKKITPIKIVFQDYDSYE